LARGEFGISPLVYHEAVTTWAAVEDCLSFSHGGREGDVARGCGFGRKDLRESRVRGNRLGHRYWAWGLVVELTGTDAGLRYSFRSILGLGRFFKS